MHGSTKSHLVFPQLHAQIVKPGADAHVTRKGRINRISLVGSLETRIGRVAELKLFVHIRDAGFVICRRREHAIRIYYVLQVQNPDFR